MKMLGLGAASNLKESKNMYRKSGKTYIVTLTVAHNLHGWSVKNIHLAGVAFAGYLVIFIYTKSVLCPIGAVPNSTKVVHGAGGTGLPWEATFLKLSKSRTPSAVLFRGRILWTEKREDGTNTATQLKGGPIDLPLLSRTSACAEKNDYRVKSEAKHFLFDRSRIRNFCFLFFIFNFFLECSFEWREEDRKEILHTFPSSGRMEGHHSTAFHNLLLIFDRLTQAKNAARKYFACVSSTVSSRERKDQK